MYKVIQLISIFLYSKKHAPSMKVHVHWMNLMKNQIIQKFQSLEILKKRATKKKTQYLKPFDKKIMFKMSSFTCKSHVQEIILSKNMFGCPLKFILRFFKTFCIYDCKPKYSHTIMYECENSPLSHELS
jgi:hypothetical protein